MPQLDFVSGGDRLPVKKRQFISHSHRAPPVSEAKSEPSPVDRDTGAGAQEACAQHIIGTPRKTIDMPRRSACRCPRSPMVLHLRQLRGASILSRGRLLLLPAMSGDALLAEAASPRSKHRR